MTHAIAILEAAAEQHETNAVAHSAEGDLKQAALCREVSSQCYQAMRDIQSIHGVQPRPEVLVTKDGS